ncbi:MAG: winged helix-turn-helix transcriptional regulator [Promethearchaeota archaeon]
MITTQFKFTMDGYNELSRKWAISIIKSMFLGCKRFSDFLEVHNGLSNRVLSDQLKRLEHYGFIRKEIVSKSPVKIEYSLTEIGRDLNKMLYEKCMFAIRQGLISRDDPYFRGKNLEEAFGMKE